MKNIGLIIVLVVIIIFVIIYFKNKNSDTKEIDNPVKNLVQGSGLGNLGNIISSGNVPSTTTTTPSTSTTPVTIKTSDFSFGDKLYSKTNGLNLYKSTNISSSNLAISKSYSRDEFLGSFLSYESNGPFLPKYYSKISVSFSPYVAYAKSSDLYSK